MTYQELEPKIIKAVIKQRPADVCAMFKEVLSQQKAELVEKEKKEAMMRQHGYCDRKHRQQNKETLKNLVDDINRIGRGQWELIIKE